MIGSPQRKGHRFVCGFFAARLIALGKIRLECLHDVLLVLFALTLAACHTVPTPDERRQHADALAVPHGWHAIHIPAGQFGLIAYLPAKPRKNEALTIYLEGDGFAWRTVHQPSADPTPLDPIALRLALAHPQGNAAYLARPCQYAGARTSLCAEVYWTNQRFAPEVVDAINRAIDALKARFDAQRLNLVGYSGGATVAALAAVTRHDVDRLVTVAGNLDHRSWTTYHRIQPLTGSLNPADAVDALLPLRKWHFAGGRDEIMPPVLVSAFANRFPRGRQSVVHIEPDFNHRCCWAENWPRLWREVVMQP